MNCKLFELGEIIGALLLVALFIYIAITLIKIAIKFSNLLLYGILGIIGIGIGWRVGRWSYPYLETLFLYIKSMFC